MMMLLEWIGAGMWMLVQAGSFPQPTCGPGSNTVNPLCQPEGMPPPRPVQMPPGAAGPVEVVLEDGGRPASRPDVLYFSGTGVPLGDDSSPYAPCQALIKLRGFRDVRTPLHSGGRTLVVLMRLGAEGQVFPKNEVSVQQLRIPKLAHQAYAKGEAAAGLEVWPEAEKWFRAAVKAYPEMVPAWDELGWALERQGREGEAQEAYQKALAVDRNFVRAYVHLAGQAIVAGRWAEAARWTGHALGLRPEAYPRAYFYDAMANFNLHRLKEAESSALQTIAADPGHAFGLAEYLLGMVLAENVDAARAAEHLEAFLKLEPRSAFAPSARTRLAQLEAASKR